MESGDGLERGLLARYTSRPVPTVELFTDTLALAEELIDRLGWRHWYPAGSVREAAIAHEAVHEQLHHGPAKAALKRSLGHVVLRAGRHRLYGHVAGADEIAAHAYARTVCGLGRSPLLLTAALATAPIRSKAPRTEERSNAMGVVILLVMAAGVAAMLTRRLPTAFALVILAVVIAFLAGAPLTGENSVLDTVIQEGAPPSPPR